MAHVAFVESNTTGTGRIAVERLLARGDRVTFITHKPERYPFLQPPHAPHLSVVTADTNDVEAVARSVEALRREGPLEALLTFSTFYVPTVATVAARFGLRYLQPRAAQACHHKHLARAVLREAGLPGPDFHVLSFCNGTPDATCRDDNTRYPARTRATVGRRVRHWSWRIRR